MAQQSHSIGLYWLAHNSETGVLQYRENKIRPFGRSLAVILLSCLAARLTKRAVNARIAYLMGHESPLKGFSLVANSALKQGWACS